MNSAAGDMARLDEIRRELGQFGPEYGEASGEYVRRKYDYKKAEAAALLVATGPNAGAREAMAVQQLVNEGWFDALAVAEAKKEAMDAVFKVLNAEMMAIQSRLKVDKAIMGGG